MTCEYCRGVGACPRCWGRAAIEELTSRLSAAEAARDRAIRITVEEAAQIVAESGPLTLQRKDLERRILALAGAPRTTPPEAAPGACTCVRGPSSVVPSQSCPVHGFTPPARSA